MCMQAENMASTFEKVDLRMGKTTIAEQAKVGTSGPFLKQLVTQVLWSRKEKYDDVVNQIVEESSSARQK